MRKVSFVISEYAEDCGVFVALRVMQAGRYINCLFTHGFQSLNNNNLTINNW